MDSVYSQLSYRSPNLSKRESGTRYQYFFRKGGNNVAKRGGDTKQFFWRYIYAEYAPPPTHTQILS